MEIDSHSLKVLKEMDNRKIANLLKGVYDFLGKRFPSKNFTTNAGINENGYHMSYLETEYEINFVKGKNLSLNIRAELRNPDSGLERRVNELKISNEQLGLTDYLAGQSIKVSANDVKISCRIKKTPLSNTDIESFCHLLWGKILKPVMAGITNQSYQKP